MSVLYGVNRAFQSEATKLLRDYVAVIALMLEQSQARGEIRCHHVEAAALMVLSLTKSFVLRPGCLDNPNKPLLSRQDISLISF